MIISLEGIQGSGKSTIGTSMVYEDFLEHGVKVISNDHLNTEFLPDFQHLTLEWFMDHLLDEEMEDCDIFLDEFHQIMDSRSSQTKVNKMFSYFVAQCRKRGVDLYVATHHIGNIDIRVQRAIDIRGACRGYEENPCKKCKGSGEYKDKPCDRCKGYGNLGIYRVILLDRRKRRRYFWDAFGPDYWHLFSTKERIPFQARLLRGIDTTELI